jgi:hypothetical protein
LISCWLTTQRAVERDKQSRSNYAMCAVIVSKTLDGAALREVVDTISNLRDCLLEIVNLNVEVRRVFLFVLGTAAD